MDPVIVYIIMKMYNCTVKMKTFQCKVKGYINRCTPVISDKKNGEVGCITT